MDRNLPSTQPGKKLSVRNHHSYTSQRTDSDWKPVQDGSTGFAGLTSAAWEGGAELRPSFLLSPSEDAMMLLFTVSISGE